MTITEAFKELKKSGGYATRGRESFFYLTENDKRILSLIKIGKTYRHNVTLNFRLLDLLSDKWSVLNELPTIKN